ncbi:DUF5776 domain-containing protein [Levilactobacillus wangkuiensis]|uniref:DUF5776 domain-containing protein n=1 Tax=Levilactobacillus wangkuiensis TaxID=2799566 RepID=UPI0019449624|nr:DUF5776 domain-containing protein [Levilactobacillus wangkuiensis]
MKGNLFRTFCLSILSTIVLLTSLVLVNPASAQAATPPTDAATSLDLNQTIDQAFPNYQTDQNEAIVRDALLNAEYPYPYTGQIDSTSTLKDVQNSVPRVIITKSMTNYAPLIKVVGLARSLRLANQLQLSEDNLYDITQSLMINRTDIGSLEFPNDDLTDTDLEMLIGLAKKYTPNQQSDYISLLDLSHNKLSNFNSWAAFKNSDDKNVIGALNAPMQDSETTAILPAQNLTGTSIKIPFTDLPEITTNFADSYSDEYTLVNASLTSNKDFFDKADNFDNQDRIIINLVTDQLSRDDTNNSSDTDFSDMYTIVLSPDTYTQTLNISTLRDLLSDYDPQDYVLPADTTHLTINNIPAGSHQLTLKIANLVYLTYPQMWTTYVQNYTIPLKSPATSNTVTSVESNESSESTTVNTPTPVADKAQSESKVVYATKKIGLYKSPTFTNQARIRWYTKAKRTNRPMFKVIGYARSKNGVLRYKVKDVTPNTKTNGQTGYITTKDSFVSHDYYQTQAKKIKVLRGLNSYKTKALTGKKIHYRKHQVIQVKKLVTHNLTTRYQLPNGCYVSANKRLVIQVK